MRKRIQYWYKSLALLIAGGFIYVQATALNCGIHEMVEKTNAAHHDHEKNEHGCCSDLTQAFFSTFSRSSVEQADHAPRLTSPAFPVLFASVLMRDHFSVASSLLCDPHLSPPKIPDIGLFTHSFRI
ncbi:MAG TPA: hypothetical protein VL651_06550 [Bacteroidia bacterium]|jgi:hypothetical protein|nr:hypothetical protein [Bacteroidia bacterium]